MNINITNWRGCQSAILEVGEETLLITGDNGAGKSSFCDAIRSAVTKQPITDGTEKKDAHEITFNTLGGGECFIKSELGESVVTLPECHAGGSLPAQSLISAGVQQLPKLPLDKQMNYLSVLLKTKPTKEDLIEALPSAKPAMIDKAWRLIETLGWDKACEALKGEGQQLKGAWKQITGKQYGVKVAETWKPANWTNDLRDAKEEDLIAEATKANEEFENALKNSGNADRAKQVKANIERIPGLKTRLAELKTIESDAVADAKKKEAEYNALPLPAEKPNAECPHCNKALIVRGGSVHLPAPIDKTESVARQKAREALAHEIKGLAGTIESLHTQIRSVEADLAVCERDKSAGSTESTAVDIDKARQQKAIADGLLQAFRAQRDAIRMHDEILALVDLVKAVDIDGVRASKTQKALKPFSKLMAQISGDRITDFDGKTWTLDGRAFWQLSQGEQFRVCATAQIACALIEKAFALVIDAADRLDSMNQKWLLDAVNGAKRVPLRVIAATELQGAKTIVNGVLND